MVHFTYTALDAAGRTTVGALEAADRCAALDLLATRGLAPLRLDIRRGRDASPSTPWWRREATIFGDAIPRAELGAVLRGFSLLLGAGLPAPEALSAAAVAARDPKLRAALADAEAVFAVGGDPAEALSRHPRSVPPETTAALRIGLRADRLQEAAAEAGAVLRRDATERTEIRRALAYPALLAAAGLGVAAALIFFLAPTLEPVFRSLGAPPPPLLTWLLSIRAAALSHGWMLAAGVPAAAIAWGALRRLSPHISERIALGAPWIGPLRRAADAHRALAAIAMLLESGAPLLAAVREAGAACRLSTTNALMARLEDQVRAGGGLAEALKGAQALAPHAVRMIAVGERADRLPAILRDVIAAEELRLADRRRALIGALTPILTLGVGLLVGGLALSTLGAVLDLNDVALAR